MTAALRSAATPPAPAVAASLLSPARQRVMHAVLQDYLVRPVRVLEIGVWQAAGSTQFWLDHLPPGSEVVAVDAWRPYASAEDLDGQGTAPSSWNYAAMDQACDAAFEAACDRIRRHERAHGGRPAVQVHLVRAPAAAAMAWMRDGGFDIVYVDGDHKYEQVKADLAQARRLVNPRRGLVCGDDLERLPDADTLALARRHTRRDYLGAPHRFHPGVCLAVHECFDTVAMADGFWWTHARDGVFAPSLTTHSQEHAR